MLSSIGAGRWRAKRAESDAVVLGPRKRSTMHWQVGADMVAERRTRAPLVSAVPARRAATVARLLDDLVDLAMSGLSCVVEEVDERLGVLVWVDEKCALVAEILVEAL